MVPKVFEPLKFDCTWPGRVGQSVGYLTCRSRVLGSIPGLATYFRFSFAFSRRAVVSYWRKYVHEVLVNRLGGLSLSRKSVVRCTDRPDMTLDVYRGRKTTLQQQQQSTVLLIFLFHFFSDEMSLLGFWTYVITYGGLLYAPVFIPFLKKIIFVILTDGLKILFDS